jgi:hypothetical protein
VVSGGAARGGPNAGSITIEVGGVPRQQRRPKMPNSPSIVGLGIRSEPDESRFIVLTSARFFAAARALDQTEPVLGSCGSICAAEVDYRASSRLCSAPYCRTGKNLLDIAVEVNRRALRFWISCGAGDRCDL